MRRTAFVIGFLLGLVATAGAAEDSDYRICVIDNERVMGLANSESYCSRVQAEGRERREAGGLLSIQTREAASGNHVAQYRICLANNHRLMGSMAESYCNRLREEARQRREASGG